MRIKVWKERAEEPEDEPDRRQRDQGVDVGALKP
jgi:hypothetical protein